MNLRVDGDNLILTIKSASYFPYYSGHLRDDATSGDMISKDTYLIKFDGQIAPYVEFLEEGTTAHDIFNAFGYAKGNNPKGIVISETFGYGGRFNGFFHPGSTKHYHFIQDKVIDTILMYFVLKYNGEVRLWLTWKKWRKK